MGRAAGWPAEGAGKFTSFPVAVIGKDNALYFFALTVTQRTVFAVA